MHERDHAVVIPLKQPVLVAGHLEWLQPLAVSCDVLVEAQQQVEEPAVRQDAIRTDRVRLKTPRFDAVRAPSGASYCPRRGSAMYTNHSGG